ncbi:GSCOCG00010450001-RA-CDS [Cotesia congregata]|nr:GSCOCG00010450001-RA-CDS [Cotesia congregata]
MRVKMSSTLIPILILIFIPSFITTGFNYSSEYSDTDKCPKAEFIAGQLGVVNVLGFLDPTQPSSYRQAVMLKVLKDRLKRSGLPEALFFVIINSRVSEDEENHSISSFKSAIAPDIFIIEDNEQLNIRKNFNGSKDQVLVIDRCGYLAYQIVLPWSILHFPYVKAAILSTHKDDPCGPCDTYATDVVELDEIETCTLTYSIPATSEVTEATGAYVTYSEEKVLPDLKIIMHAPHYHMSGDATKKHEYLVLEHSKPDFHGHLDVPDSSTDERSGKLGDGLIISDSTVYERDQGPGFFGEVADIWRNSVNFDQQVDEDEEDEEDEEELSEKLQISQSTEANGQDVNDNEEEIKSKLIAHYSKLVPWIYYILEK